MAPASVRRAAQSPPLSRRRRLSTRWRSRPAVAGAPRGREFAARPPSETEAADSGPTCTYSVDGSPRPHPPRRSAVATTPADGRRSPRGRRWCLAAGAPLTRAADAGSCTNTSDRNVPRPPAGTRLSVGRRPTPPHPIDSIRRQRLGTTTSFPAEVRCTRTSCRDGGIYRCHESGSTARRGHLPRDRCRKMTDIAPWNSIDCQRQTISYDQLRQRVNSIPVTSGQISTKGRIADLSPIAASDLDPHLTLTFTAVAQWPNGSMPDCGVRGPRFESHRWQLCLSRQSLRYTALGTGCTPLLQCLRRLSLSPSVGR